MKPALLLAVATLLSATEARAHFKLIAPQASYTQDGFGSPQKDRPCGPAAGAGTASGAVTVYKPGDTISITINETVYHPGHYRVSLAKDEASLPPDPAVKVGASQCGSADITANPTLPILKDGALLHSSPFAGDQTFQVQLPANFTCNKCMLQVLEFMSSHGAPCFYYHCATITVAAPDGGGGGPDAATPTDAATPPADATMGTPDTAPGGEDGGTTPPGPGTGCSCRIGTIGAERTNGLGILLLGVVGWGLRRRRKVAMGRG